MSIFFPEPDFKAGELGFEGNCDLGRAASGKKLSELVEKISEPVVIAVDGPWGSGKSHFLKLWTGEHMKEEKYTTKVIYFDAFKHDYFDDPLVALVGQIFEDFSEDKTPDGKMTAFLKQAGRLVKPATRIALAAGTGFVSEAVGAVASATIQAVGKEAENALDPVWENESKRRDAMEEFKKALKDLTIENSSEDKPQKLVIIVDELDRCRPDFALNMLETIKHFFVVENVVFVLGVNLAELENSVKGRYGANTNAGKYLQKFVQLVFPIVEPQGRHLSVNTGARYFDQLRNGLASEAPPFAGVLSEYLARMPHGNQISLREAQRLMTKAKIIEHAGTNNTAEMNALAGLMIIEVCRPEWLNKIRNNTLNVNDALSLFGLSVRDIGSAEIRDAYFTWKLALDPEPSDITDSVQEPVIGIGNVNNKHVRKALLSKVLNSQMMAFYIP